MRTLIAAFFFCTLLFVSDAFSQSGAEAGGVFWRGSVDEKVHLVIKGTTLQVRTIAGREMPAGEHSFIGPLPSTEVNVTVARMEGRGTVAVVQQPNQQNAYTAIIELVDGRGGNSEYLLEIIWRFR